MNEKERARAHKNILRRWRGTHQETAWHASSQKQQWKLEGKTEGA